MPDDPSELEALAARGVSRVLVPVSPIAGLSTAIASPEEVAGWKGLVEEYAAL